MKRRTRHKNRSAVRGKGRKGDGMTGSQRRRGGSRLRRERKSNRYRRRFREWRNARCERRERERAMTQQPFFGRGAIECEGERRGRGLLAEDRERERERGRRVTEERWQKEETKGDRV